MYYKAPFPPLVGPPLSLSSYLDCRPNSSIQSPRRIVRHAGSDCPDVSPWLRFRPTPSSPNLPHFGGSRICRHVFAQYLWRAVEEHDALEDGGQNTERKEIVINCRVTMPLPIMAQLPRGLIQFPFPWLRVSCEITFYCRISLFTF